MAFFFLRMLQAHQSQINKRSVECKNLLQRCESTRNLTANLKVRTSKGIFRKYMLCRSLTNRRKNCDALSVMLRIDWKGIYAGVWMDRECPSRMLENVESGRRARIDGFLQTRFREIFTEGSKAGASAKRNGERDKGKAVKRAGAHEHAPSFIRIFIPGRIDG